MKPDPAEVRFALRLVALASLLVPSHLRGAWLEEWRSEIWHYGQQLPSQGPQWARGRLALRCLGAFPHALSILIHHWRFDMLSMDLRLAFRRIFRDRGFAAVAVFTVALGIGANVAIFSVVDAVVFAPLPYDDPRELVAVWEWNVASHDRRNVVNPGNYNAWRQRSASFRGMAALFPNQLVLTGAGEPEEVDVRITSGNLFQVLGVEAALGRTYTRADLDEGNRPLVLTHSFWRGKLGGDPEVVGRSLTFSGQSAVVVGVLPPIFMAVAPDADVFSPMDFSAMTPDQSGRSGRVVARLAEGATLEAARSELRTIAARLQEEYPEIDSGWSVSVVPLREDLVGDVRPALLVLLASVGALLIIACGNVANLLLARGASRRREMAIRTSLGAGRTRLARQLLTDAGVLAMAGALAGTALAHLATRIAALRLGGTFPLPRLAEASVNGRVLLFTVAATVLTGLAFGVVPAIQGSGVRPVEALKDGGRRGGGGGAGRGRGLLVVGEVALSLILLVAAGLLARSFLELTSVDSGIRTENVVTARLNLGGPAYREAEARVRFHEELRKRLEALPGVRSAGMNVFLPLDGRGSATEFYPEDRSVPPPGERPAADVRMVQGAYFASMGIPVLQGRTFDDRDRADGPRVALVNRSLARQEWPGESPVGKRLAYNWGPWESVEVVGVVADVRLAGLDSEPRPAIYLPYAQNPAFSFATVTVRTLGEPDALLREVEEAVRELDPALPVSRTGLMDDVVSGSVARPRATAVLMTAFAAVALILAGVGLYGVLSYAVSQRVGEVGIRMALGARARDVLGLVVRQGMTLAGFGALVGLLGALFAARLVEGLLFRVPATDPLVFAAVPAFLLAVALLACALPAWRAATVDPSEALRRE